MPRPRSNALATPPPVLRRATIWFIVLCVFFSTLAVAAVVARRRLGFPNQGWFRIVPLVAALTPIVVLAPLWWRRTRWVRRAVARSGWRACTHCAYDVSGLPPAGTCPECGEEYDVEKDAAVWEDAGMPRPRDNTTESPSQPP